MPGLDDHQKNLEAAIACYEAALQVYTREEFPLERARVQNNLGDAYSELLSGTRQANLERALACYRDALQIYTLEDFPEEWAKTQNHLGSVYAQRQAGDRRENLEETIACYEKALQVYTRKDTPIEWAMTQTNLGKAYMERIAGDRSKNLEEASACYEAVLQVYTFKDMPSEWAMTQTNLGKAYMERLIGDRSKNIEQAIAYYEKALQVYTCEIFPARWAELYWNLGKAYSKRIVGKKSTNWEMTVSCYEKALQIYTQEAFPKEWALLHDDLIKARRNLEKFTDQTEFGISPVPLKVAESRLHLFPQSLWHGKDRSETSASELAKTLEVFLSYTHKDKDLRDELMRYLNILQRQGSIRVWDSGMILGGQAVRFEIEKHLNTADIILLLVSSEFLSSDYCYREMKRALERHAAGEARAIPIILRPTDWRHTPLNNLPVLPTDAKPVTSWADSAGAFLDVVQGVQQAVEDLDLSF